MFFPESNLTIWLYVKATDMRKSFDGLAALAKNKLKESPVSGALFVFINKGQTYIKILYFDRSGYCLWSKRLEQDRFNYSKNKDEKQRLDWTQLKLILEGIDVKNIHQVEKILGDFKGTLLTDGYTAYEQFQKNKPDITHVQCWVHNRRYYEKSKNIEPEMVAVALAYIARLYQIEAHIRE